MSPPKATGKNHRILVVDDNAAIHEDFRKILASDQADARLLSAEAAIFGEKQSPVAARAVAFELSFATQGAQALEIVKAASAAGQRFALVFTDMRMPPGWDGLETAIRLWEVDPDLQIVICTAYSDRSWEEMMEKITRPERLLILKKPFDTVEVLQMAHALTEKWSLLQSSYRNLLELERAVTGRTHDLTAAHQELRATEQRFRTLSASAPVGIFETDADGLWIYVNACWEEISGQFLEEAIGNGWRQVMHPEDQPRVYVEWREAVAAESEFAREFRYRRPTGKIRWVHARAVPIRAEDGKVTGYVGTVEDITERKLIENELRTSEMKFRSVTQSINNAIISANIWGEIVFWNNGAEKMFGHREEEILGKSLELLMPEGYWPVYRAGMSDLRAGGEFGSLGKTVELLACRMDGAQFPIELSLSAWSASDGTYFTGIVRDITRRKLAERAMLEAKEEAEQASRTKSDFLANMSHEIRTPMNGVIGMTELTLETDLTREQREYLTMTRNSAQSLLVLINDILDFSKIEAGKLDLESIGFSLRDCIGGTLKPLGLRADQKGIELTADIPASVPDHFLGDPMRLRQILINLTDNAIKFTREGDVTLRVTLESPPGAEYGHYLHFSVTDTGIGIPLEKQALIFEAFSQADGTTTRHFGGTGLGLAIASELVRKMEGHIWVESQVDSGTTFHFTARLPVIYDDRSPGTDAGPYRDLDGLRALVVDDHPGSRRIAGEMLENWRMSPRLIANATDALAEMEKAARGGLPYDLVILDANMPGIDGFTLASEIQRRPWISARIVMLLSPAMPTGAAKCEELGIIGRVTKPVAQSELLDAILHAVHGPVQADLSPVSASPAASPGGLRILIAEDNVINRAVATGILEKRGHLLIHAATGLEAVKAAAADPEIDVILMDVQMPEMDGLEATAHIRASEAGRGRHTPIIAMTAHAMAGDRERCIAAGMDDYISKPLKKETLLAMLDRIRPGHAAGSSVGAATTPKAPAPAGYRERLLARLDGNAELVTELLALFKDNTPRLTGDIRISIRNQDAHALYRAAHALLSSLGVFGADEALRITGLLEDLGRSGTTAGSEPLFAALEKEIDMIYASL